VFIVDLHSKFYQVLTIYYVKARGQSSFRYVDMMQVVRPTEY